MTGVPRAPKLTPDGKPGAWAPSRAMSALSIQMPSSLSEVMPAPVRNDLCAVWVELTVGLPRAPKTTPAGVPGAGLPSRATRPSPRQMPSLLAPVTPVPVRKELCAMMDSGLTVGAPRVLNTTPSGVAGRGVALLDLEDGDVPDALVVG